MGTIVVAGMPGRTTSTVPLFAARTEAQYGPERGLRRGSHYQVETRLIIGLPRTVYTQREEGGVDLMLCCGPAGQHSALGPECPQDVRREGSGGEDEGTRKPAQAAQARSSPLGRQPGVSQGG